MLARLSCFASFPFHLKASSPWDENSYSTTTAHSNPPLKPFKPVPHRWAATRVPNLIDSFAVALEMLEMQEQGEQSVRDSLKSLDSVDDIWLSPTHERQQTESM